MPRRGRLGVSRPRRLLGPRATIRARTARRSPRRRRGRTRREAGAPVRTAHPPRRRLPVPVPLRARPRGPAREHLAGQTATPTTAVRPARHRHRRGPLTAMQPARDFTHETIFARSREPAYVMDPEHNRILAANDAGCALLGYTREELLEKIGRAHV